MLVHLVVDATRGLDGEAEYEVGLGVDYVLTRADGVKSETFVKQHGIGVASWLSETSIHVANMIPWQL